MATVFPEKDELPTLTAENMPLTANAGESIVLQRCETDKNNAVGNKQTNKQKFGYEESDSRQPQTRESGSEKWKLGRVRFAVK